MAVQQFLGDDCGPPVPTASGVPMSFRAYRAYTVLTNEADGSTILTVTQHTTASDGVSQDTESALGLTKTCHKLVGAGGQAAVGPAGVAGVYDLADDATYDAMILTVRADELSDGYDWVEFTVDGGTCLVIPHAPRYKPGAVGMLSPIAHP